MTDSRGATRGTLARMTDTIDTSDAHDCPAGPASPDSPDTPGASEVSYLSIQQAAAALGISERQVRRYIKARRLRAERTRGHHGVQVVIPADAVADLRGQRAALEQDALTGTDTMDTPDRPDTPAVRPADVLALVAAVADRLEAQYQARLADKDAQIADLRRVQDAARQQAEELGRERALRETAEREVAELRRSRRSVPWWVRLLVGDR